MQEVSRCGIIINQLKLYTQIVLVEAVGVEALKVSK